MNETTGNLFTWILTLIYLNILENRTMPASTDHVNVVETTEALSSTLVEHLLLDGNTEFKVEALDRKNVLQLFESPVSAGKSEAKYYIMYKRRISLKVFVLYHPQQLSQFWYDTETALRLANEAVRAAGRNGKIACVSAPSIYQKLKELNYKDFSACVLEYDQRFSVHGTDYVFYDYKNPLNLPANLAAHSFDIVLADPPYLSEECLRKTAETIKYLTKGKILLCTGSVMEEYAAKFLGVKMCKFIPKHTRNLANEFRCYTNYDSGLDFDCVS
ncbi:EEF1A lysine methyltransferase 1 [Varanus komodoensis]|nr:EEF1A lysine methyltransferase 1 [Varanus komodoensis]